MNTIETAVPSSTPEKMSGRHGSASSGGSGWLAKRRGLIIAGLFIVAAAAFAVSQNWIAFATLLPLLFVLPCAAMMVMCMKGMGNGQQPNANQDQSAGSSDSLGDTRK